MGSFTDSLRKNIERVKTEVDDKCYAVAHELFTAVVQLSPTQPSANYAKGQFINNWFAAADGFNLTTTTATSYDGMGSLNSITGLKNSKAFYGKDGFVSLSNSLNYAMRVEYLGWARTGPYAPVRTALTMVAAKRG